MHELEKNDIIANRYRLLRRLSHGATANTWLALDTQRKDQEIALKIFKAEWAKRRPDLIDAEFRTLARLTHPHIAAVLDFGESEGQFFLASEFVPGLPLLEGLKGFSLPSLVWIFSQLFEALDYLYFRNVVHLDLKPANILLADFQSGGERNLKILDFGLAHWTTAPAPSGQALGSPPFTAPEFALRRGIDSRSDLYSVGALLYFALTGAPPFPWADPLTMLNYQLQRDPIPPRQIRPELGAPLSDFVLRLLCRDPSGRPSHPRAALREFYLALGELSAAHPIRPAPFGEDPDLLFRPSLFQKIFSGLLNREGTWLLEGAPGAGKSFMLRALQRSLWEQGRRCMLWRGADLALLEPPQESAKQIVFLIDDADLGLTHAWLRSRIPSRAVLAGRDLSGFSELSATRVLLEALSELEARAVLEKLLPNTPDPIVGVFQRLTAGRPNHFFRLAHQLTREGIVQKSGHGWRLDEPKFLSRYAKEDPGKNEEEHQVLRLLSCCEVALDRATLASILNWNEPELSSVLRDLEEQGRLGRNWENGRLVFSALESNVDLNYSLPRTEFLEMTDRLFQNGYYRQGLAAFARFFPNISEEDSELFFLKLRLLSSAGHHAEVKKILEKTSASFPSQSHQALIWELQGKAALFLGEEEAADELLLRSEIAYLTCRDMAGQCRAMMHRGILAQRQSRKPEAKKLYRKAAKCAEQAASTLLQGAVALNFANLHYDASRLQEAEAQYQIALQKLRASGHGPLQAQACLNLGNFYLFAGKPLSAQHLVREALRIALEHRFFLTQGRALLLLAALEESQGNSTRQGQHLEEAVEVFSQAGLNFEMAQARIHRAYFYQANGASAAAEADAQAALAAITVAGDLRAQAQLVLAKILMRDPEREQEAGTYLDSAWEHLGESHNRLLKWECRELRAEFAASHGQWASARAQLEQTIGELESFLSEVPEEFREGFLRNGKLQRLKTALQNLEGKR